MEVYRPDIDYFKEMFPIFTIADSASNTAGEISKDFVVKQIDGITEHVKSRLERLGFEIPTEENKLPSINLKNYICFSAANLLRFQYAGESEVLKDLDERTKMLEEAFLKDLSDRTDTLQNAESFPLHGVNLKP